MAIKKEEIVIVRADNLLFSILAVLKDIFDFLTLLIGAEGT
jgi:hypothetical protein